MTGSFEDDWLKLQANSLRRQGYTVNNLQVIGAVSLDAEHNPQLVDRSNREGLIDCPEKELLRKLITEFLVPHLRSAAEKEAKVGQEVILKDISKERIEEAEQEYRQT